MSLSVMDILNRVKTGDMTAAEGAANLEVIESMGEEVFISPTRQDAPTGTEKFEPEIGWWKYAWLIVFLAGTVIFVLGAWIISWAYPNRLAFWYYCAWLPLVLGLAVLLIGAWSHFARWAHIRVRPAEGPRVSISLPLPTLLISIGIRLFGSRIKGLRDQNPADIAAVVEALGKTHDPISVEVDEKDGDQVRVYIL